jgi:hypothetical protein
VAHSFTSHNIYFFSSIIFYNIFYKTTFFISSHWSSPILIFFLLELTPLKNIIKRSLELDVVTLCQSWSSGIMNSDGKQAGPTRTGPLALLGPRPGRAGPWALFIYLFFFTKRVFVKKRNKNNEIVRYQTQFITLFFKNTKS